MASTHLAVMLLALATSHVVGQLAGPPNPVNDTASASPSSPVLRSRPGRVVVPRGMRLLENTPMATSLPNIKALSLQEIDATRAPGLGPVVVPSSDADNTAPQANGVAGASYSDSRFGLNGAEYASLASRRIGRLKTRVGGTWYQCTAAVINKALLVTAAHCVFQFGKAANGWPDYVNGQIQIVFEPGLDGSTLPYGSWSGRGALVPYSYYDGTDTNGGTPGVTVNNDIALVWLYPLNGKQIGDVTGWFGYAANGYGFVASAAGFGLPTAPASVQLTQFGYPVAFDSGSRMQVGNTATYMFATSTPDFKNIIRGSSMTSGSSGGPWIANYGVDAAVSGTTYGQNAVRNVITGVTSWGYTDVNTKAQGASYFGSNKQFPVDSYGTRGPGNIGKLVYDACDNVYTGSWNLKAQGLCV